MKPPAWALASSAAAPVLLIGGWTLAATRQPGGFDQVSRTISALAAHGAADRWIMTSALYGVGACHLITAAGLRGAGAAGRAVLAAGGVATLLVAAFPLPSVGGDGGSPAHGAVATVSFAALGVWPALAVHRPFVPPAPALATTAVLAAVTGWFGAALNGPHVGLAERVAAGAQALVPLLGVLWRRSRGSGPS